MRNVNSFDGRREEAHVEFPGRRSSPAMELPVDELAGWICYRLTGAL